jgi:hypothetical protein
MVLDSLHVSIIAFHEYKGILTLANKKIPLDGLLLAILHFYIMMLNHSEAGK